MSLTAQQSTQLESLLTDLADEQLDAHGRVALEELLKSEPEARDHYIRFMALCSDLHDAAAMALSLGDGVAGNGTTPADTLHGVASLQDALPVSERPDHVAASLRDAKSGPRGQRRWWPVWTAIGGSALMLAIVTAAMWWAQPSGTTSTPHIGFLVGRLEEFTGTVEIGDGQGSYVQAAMGLELRSGQSVVTRGPEAHAAIRLRDDTVLMLAGETRLAFPLDEVNRVNVERGNLVAGVQPRPADRPLVICTPEASVQVLGTRLSVSREPKRTRVTVLDGEIRITRLSDQRELALDSGQAAEVSPETDLRAAPIQRVPDHWAIDFNDGLPDGWQTGQLVFDDLPDGSNAAVRTGGEMENGRRRYQIRSHNAWSEGLFSLHEDSWLHIRYRLEKPGTFLPYVVCRQHDFGQPVCTVLTAGNRRQTAADQWHTMTLAMNQLHRTKAQDRVPLDGQLVAFLLVFDSPEQNPGLTIDRIWVTRGEPAEPRSPIELIEDRLPEVTE